eukprot:52491-Eustigmatos_ZCMA.PRE.1
MANPVAMWGYAELRERVGYVVEFFTPRGSSTRSSMIAGPSRKGTPDDRLRPLARASHARIVVCT